MIRAAAPADRAGMVDLWVASWQATLPAIDFAARRNWIIAHLSTLETQGIRILVAGDPNGLAGFVTVDLATGDLDQLVVAVDRQGRGTGRALIDAAKALSPRGLTLSVNTDNPRAIAFYGGAGFAVTGHGVNPRSGLPVQTMAWTPERTDSGRDNRGLEACLHQTPSS